MSRNAPKSYRLPVVTLAQIVLLTKALGTSQAGVITLAVDRLFQKENENDKNLPFGA